MKGWKVRQLTFPSEAGHAHSHSYYDIPVIDGASRRVLVHRLSFAGRHPTPKDEITVGVVDLDRPKSFTPLGRSRAWSWQQGPMAQWVAGGPWAVWNDRGPDGFIARLVNAESGEARRLDRSVYAVTPDGLTALSLDMARLDHLRPGYGYPVPELTLAGRWPGKSGVWAVPLDGGGAPRLILSIRSAVAWLMRQLPLLDVAGHLRRRFYYWFNHAKISPDGQRFTVKLRWRRKGRGWSDRQGVSLTANLDGGDLRLLTDATSHVIWQDEARLYLWRHDRMVLLKDTAPRGTVLGQIGAEAIDANVHLRHLPPGPTASPETYVFDTPYREDVTLNLLAAETGEATRIAAFSGHVPARGPFRCDLHPCPSADGRRIVVTSPQSGARQVYVVDRTG
ncbi:MAG: hypothetical protein AAF264_00755 [Pseudomonadota bacterium]